MAFGWLLKPHSRWQSQASAYIDDELGGKARRRFEAHLGGCTACQDQVQALRQAKHFVAALPEVPAPRSFRLTPAMLGEPARAPVVASPSWAFRGAAVVAGLAAVAFVTVLAIDGSQSGGSTTSSRVPAADRAGGQTVAASNGTAAGAQENANPLTPRAATSTKGIAAPESSGAGAQSLPATPLSGATVPAPPLTGSSAGGPAPAPTAYSDGYDAGGAFSASPSTTLQSHGAPESENNAYRPIEAGLAALAAAAAAGAIFLYVRKGRS